MSDVLILLLPIVVIHALALVGIVVVIKKLLLSDTVKAVARIRLVETEVRRKEEGIRLEIEEHEKEFETKKAEAEADFDKRRTQSEQEVAQMKDATLAAAKKEGDKILEQAKKNEQKLRQQVLQDMEEKAVEYGAEVFKMVFSDVMTAALNKHFIGELLDALEEIDASSITVDTDNASFSSSHEIDPEQKERMKKLLSEKFGAEIEINEDIKPELMGGLIFKLGSLEIDGSLLNRYQEAAVEVKKTARA